MGTKILVILMAAALFCGCGGEFPNEEMDIAGEDKLRPMAVVLDPPEAAPGETVTVSLHFYCPDPSALDADWRVALDYELGLYETDETEGGYVFPDDIDPPVFDALGFGVQTWDFTVPDDVLLTTSAHPDVLDDELLLAVARPLLGKAATEPVTRTELDAYLRGATPGPETVFLADLFGCEIRFRATLRQGLTVDVTRNLTVRYSSALESANVNANPAFANVFLYGVHRPDLDADDLDQHMDTSTVRELYGREGPVTGQTIELHGDWTYFLVSHPHLQDYTSPFDPMTFREENFSTRWYHVDPDAPTAGEPFFVADDGEEAEMGDLDEIVRLARPVGDAPHRVRVYVVTRDERLEWRGVYTTTPGVAIAEVAFAFVEPGE